MCKDNGHLWRHTNESLTDFKMLTYDHEMGVPCNQKRMRTCPRMMLYAMDEMFHVFQGMGANDLNGQCVIAYEILALALLHCTEQCSCIKKHCNNLNDTYPLVDLTDVDDLECLACAVYSNVFIPGDPPMLTSHHDWSCIITGMTLHLIFHGKTVEEHCPPCTVASFNAKWAMRLTQQQGLQQPDKRRKPQATLATEVLKTPAIKSVVNVLPQAASSHSVDVVPMALLDHNEEEEEEESFHKFHHCRMMWCSPISQHIDPMCQTTIWLLTCEEGQDDEEISWWLLFSLLTNGSNVAVKDLTRWLMATWRWVRKVSKTPICLPSLTVLNIGQFLDEDMEEKGWDQPQWLWACTLQHIGEAADGRTWRPNAAGGCFY